MQFLVHHLLEDAARKFPDRPAVQDGDRILSYRQLDSLANRLAHVLLDHGVSYGDRVGLYLDKSLDAIVGAYGIMKAGAAYVPLDPEAPVLRLAHIMADCDLRVLLTESQKESKWNELIEAGSPITTFGILDTERPDDQSEIHSFDRKNIEEASAEPVAMPTIDDDLAYILYTSGSTGDPKGVMLSHRNALAFVSWAAEEFEIRSEDRLSSHAPLHFDLSVFDLYAAAYGAACVVLVPAKASYFPPLVTRFIRDHRISVWYSVPSALTMLTLRGGLDKTDLPSLRVVLFAGEVFPTKYLRQLMRRIPRARFANLYGPTETNVCTWYEVGILDEDRTSAIPIGRSIPNVRAYALKDDGTEAQVGDVGELLVGGATVMKGYWGDPARTGRSLIADPLAPERRGPVYRTGDLVELLHDGSFRYIGRRDSQVKSRGFRIELGDIESVLNAHSHIEEAAVVAVADEVVTNRLVAFVSTTGAVTEIELAKFCAERLPHYMIPESFTLMALLPKTSTGKIDRRFLRDSLVS